MSNSVNDATLIIKNGVIHTLNSKNEIVEAVAICGERIVAVGDERTVMEWCGKRTKVIDLKGKTVFPGFIDSHTHLMSYGVAINRLDLHSAGSMEEVLRLLRNAKQKGKWLVGRGWDESKWRDGRYITRWDIDRVVNDRPVALIRVCGHLCTINTKGLEVAKIPSKTEGLEKDNRGIPTGVLKEEAVERIFSLTSPTMKERVKGLRDAIRLAHSLGITSVHDNVRQVERRIYRVMFKRRELSLGVYQMCGIDMLKTIIKEKGREKSNKGLRAKCLKVLSDGSLGARTAYLTQPYKDQKGNRGVFLFARDELEDVMSIAHRNGLQIAVHAIGDGAVEKVLDAYEKIIKGSRREHRHRIEHLEVFSEESADRLAKLRIIASMQPNFIGQWGREEGMYEKRLGKKRLKETNRFSLLLDKNVNLAFGSDCMPLSPLYGIHWAVNAPFEKQRLTVEDAIRAYTLGSAYAAFEENLKGSIEVRKLADIVVLSGDPFKNPQKIKDVCVSMTLVRGEIVFRM